MKNKRDEMISRPTVSFPIKKKRSMKILILIHFPTRLKRIEQL